MEKSSSLSYSQPPVKIKYRACTSSGKLRNCPVCRPVSRDRPILVNSWKWRWVPQVCISHLAYLLLFYIVFVFRSAFSTSSRVNVSKA